MHTHFTDKKRKNVTIKHSSLAIKILKTMNVNNYKSCSTDITSSIPVETVLILGIVFNHAKKKRAWEKNCFSLWEIPCISFHPKELH